MTGPYESFDGTLVTGNFSLEWAPVPGADYYLLYHMHNQYSHANVRSTRVNDTKLIVDFPIPKGRYWWAVAAVYSAYGEDTNSSLSEVKQLFYYDSSDRFLCDIVDLDYCL